MFLVCSKLYSLGYLNTEEGMAGRVLDAILLKIMVTNSIIFQNQLLTYTKHLKLIQMILYHWMNIF